MKLDFNDTRVLCKRYEELNDKLKLKIPFNEVDLFEENTTINENNEELFQLSLAREMEFIRKILTNSL